MTLLIIKRCLCTEFYSWTFSVPIVIDEWDNCSYFSERKSRSSFNKIVLEKHIEKRLNQPKRHTGMPEQNRLSNRKSTKNWLFNWNWCFEFWIFYINFLIVLFNFVGNLNVFSKVRFLLIRHVQFNDVTCCFILVTAVISNIQLN